MDILFQNVTLLPETKDGNCQTGMYVGVSGGKIATIGTELVPAREIIDGRGRVLMPGLINAHAHAPMSVLRGYADDLELHTWLSEHVFPVEARWDGQGVYQATLYAIAEMLENGITSVSEMYYFCDDMARAFAESGMKCNLSRACTLFEQTLDTDAPNLQEVRALTRDWHGYDGGRILVEASIHAEYTSIPALCRYLAEYAAEEGLGMHVHVSETESEHLGGVERRGQTPAAYLDSLGVWNTRANAAHGVWLTDADMDILAARGVSVSHCPVSNLKLASGVARLPALRAKGVNVALGTDSVCSNNSFDLFEEIKLAAILHKGITRNPTVIGAFEAVEMATFGGAKAQGREQECGRIKEGFDADLILVENSFPVHNALSNIAYATNGGQVSLTMVRGKILYQDGELKTLDKEKIERTLRQEVMPKLFPQR